MLQKFKIKSYAIIVGLVLVLPHYANALDLFTSSCGGYECDGKDGQVCLNGSDGANGTGYICTNGKWVPMLADS